MEMNLKYLVEVTKVNLLKTFHLTSIFFRFQEDKLSVIQFLPFEVLHQTVNDINKFYSTTYSLNYLSKTIL